MGGADVGAEARAVPVPMLLASPQISGWMLNAKRRRRAELAARYPLWDTGELATEEDALWQPDALEDKARPRAQTYVPSAPCGTRQPLAAPPTPASVHNWAHARTHSGGSTLLVAVTASRRPSPDALVSAARLLLYGLLM